MLQSTLRSAWWVMRDARIFLLSAATTVAFGLALGLSGAGGEWSSLSSTSISAIVLLVTARSWCGLSIAVTALTVLRRQRDAPFVSGVGVLPAIGAMVVTVPPVAPVVVGAFLTLTGQTLLVVVGSVLMVAGALWVAAWSQAGMLIVDGRADLMEAGESSVFMTRGFRGEILGLWLLVGVGVAGATWIDARFRAFMGAYSLGPPIATLVRLALRVGSDAFCTCCIAALYFELDKTDEPRV